MAFSLRIGCTGSNNISAKFGIDNNWCSLCSGSPRSTSVMFAGDQSRSRGRNRRIKAAAAMTATGFQKDFWSLDIETHGANDRGEGKDAADASDRLDRWLRDSVVEIVKNLREAPLLVQVFPKGCIAGDNNNGGHMMTTTTATMATLVTEKRAMEENWPETKEKWGREMAPLPEGLILVEELTGDDHTEKEREGRENTTKVWGVVVQGRRGGCGPVCYLLKTTRVGSCRSGPWCTHYCLTRVKNFMESVDSQFKNLWLVQSQNQ